MRRILLVLALVVSFAAAPASGLDLTDPPDPTGLIASPNVELLTTVPSPGVVGARFRDGLMYTTATTGVFIYDIASDPASPALVGQLALPHFENEDVDLGGDILLVSNDAAESTGILYVISIADPTTPTLLSTHQMGGNPLAGGPGHTASCVLDCAFAWVTDTDGYRVLDLRDPANPQNLGTLGSVAAGSVLGTAGITHDVQVDAEGVVWAVGYGGTAGYTIPSDPDVYHDMVTGALDGDPRLGDLVTDNSEVAGSRFEVHLGTADTEYNDYVHHNSFRPANSDLVYVTEEDYNRPGCRGAGEFQVWQAPSTVDEETGVRTLTPGGQMTEIGDWTVELLEDIGQPAAMCSAHYFDVSPASGLVAQGWYQQGTRILDVSDPADIRQVAFFAPQSALSWGAYWSPVEGGEDLLYVLDASHGIDVLRVDAAPGDPEVTAPIRDVWISGAASSTFASPVWGAACQLLRI